MPCAWNATRREVYYRHEVFSEGLKAAGYEVRGGAPDGKPGNVLLIWNRYGQGHVEATRFEAGGGTVIVAENGYMRGPKDGGDYYAMALHGHNGSGTWDRGNKSFLQNAPEYVARWEALGISLQPWQTGGAHILVCPNRPFGMPGLEMPADWVQDVTARLRKLTKREIRVRPHPGNDAPKKPLAEDLAGAWCTVIWASSAGVHSLIAGVQVICESPWWIMKDVAPATLEDVNVMRVGERMAGFQRLAWAQFSLSEIASGFAFTSLLRREAQREVAPAA